MLCTVAARGTEITEGKERRNALVGVKRMVRVKDGSASSCLLACFTVVIIVVFNCLPTIFFALYSRDNSNELEVRRRIKLGLSANLIYLHEYYLIEYSHALTRQHLSAMRRAESETRPTIQ